MRQSLNEDCQNNTALYRMYLKGNVCSLGPSLEAGIYGFLTFSQGFDLRVEHTHCFSHHGEGGHYHTDTTPETVEYLGYFVLAEFLFRIDRPKETHMVGRD